MYATHAVVDSMMIWSDGLLLRPGENYRNKVGGLFSGAVLLSNGRECRVMGLVPKEWLNEKGKKERRRGGERAAFLCPLTSHAVCSTVSSSLVRIR